MCKFTVVPIQEAMVFSMPWGMHLPRQRQSPAANDTQPPALSNASPASTQLATPATSPTASRSGLEIHAGPPPRDLWDEASRKFRNDNAELMEQFEQPLLSEGKVRQDTSPITSAPIEILCRQETALDSCFYHRRER